MYLLLTILFTIKLHAHIDILKTIIQHKLLTIFWRVAVYEIQANQSNLLTFEN